MPVSIEILIQCILPYKIDKTRRYEDPKLLKMIR